MKSAGLCVFLTLLIGACSKQRTDLGEDYPLLIGKWESIADDPADRSHIEFRKNGRLILEFHAERGQDFKIDHLLSSQSITFQGQNYESRLFTGKRHTYYQREVTIWRKPDVADSIIVIRHSDLLGDTLDYYAKSVFYRIK